MMNALNFVKFSQLQNWSVLYLTTKAIVFNRKYMLSPIGSFLSKSEDSICILDDEQYVQITVHTNNGGLEARDVKPKLGKDIGTKRQYRVHVGQFLVSKIDARNGAFGIVPSNLENAIVTHDFPVFNVDKSKLNPEYLLLIATSKHFKKIAQDCSSGTTNRQRIDIKKFLAQKIPLPQKSQQDEIVSKYKQTIAEAEAKESEALKLGNDIEQYLLDKLGICFVNNKNKTNGVLQTVRFSNLNRWDVYNINNSFIPLFEKSLYPIVNIGNVFDFTTRTWDKREPVFNYVEIGAVDPLLGIVSSQEIKTSKAPSRATQVIREGDLIIGTTRPYLKKFAIVNDKYDSCVCSSGFQVIVPNTETNVEFLYEYLKSSIAVAQFEFFMTGALYPAITTKDLKKILIPLPPIDIQNKIVAHIAEMKSQIKMLRQQAIDLRDKALKDFEKEIFE